VCLFLRCLSFLESLGLLDRGVVSLLLGLGREGGALEGVGVEEEEEEEGWEERTESDRDSSTALGWMDRTRVSNPFLLPFFL